MGIRIAFVLAGVAVLLVRDAYGGPHRDLVHSYAGNVSVSFAVYFILVASTLGARFGPAWAVGAALLAVEAFEIADGFGVMSNVYDPLDLVANAVGVAVAWGIDRLLTTRLSSSSRSRPGA